MEEENRLIQKILDAVVARIGGSRAAIFLDGEGEAIAQSGETKIDVKLIGAWKEIELDRIKEISNRLRLGNVQAVLFSREEGHELLMPVADEYCLLLFLSSYANIKEAMEGLKKAVVLLRKEVE